MLYRLLVLAIVGIGLALEAGCSGAAQPSLDKSKGGGGAGLGSVPAAGGKRARPGS
jgi:hypothetical protein